MTFGCTGCGLCCKMVGKVKENATEENTDKVRLAAIRSFPYEIKEDGSCSKLVNNRCTVYDKRPVLCNVEAMHKLTSGYMEQKDYFNMASTVCNQLMDDAGSTNERVKWIPHQQQ